LCSKIGIIMDDSTNKPEPPVRTQNLPEGVTAIIVKNPLTKDQKQTYREMLKGADGKFKKKERPLPSSIEATRTVRNYVMKPKEGQTKSELLKMTENMVDIANNRDVNPKTGLRDPKMAGVAVQAYEKVMERAFGKLPIADIDRDSLKYEGPTLIVMPQVEIMHSKVIEETKEEKDRQPIFADVVSIKTNE
jgi:hypothetical protein